MIETFRFHHTPQFTIGKDTLRAGRSYIYICMYVFIHLVISLFIHVRSFTVYGVGGTRALAHLYIFPHRYRETRLARLRSSVEERLQLVLRHRLVEEWRNIGTQAMWPGLALKLRRWPGEDHRIIDEEFVKLGVGLNRPE